MKRVHLITDADLKLGPKELRLVVAPESPTVIQFMIWRPLNANEPILKKPEEAENEVIGLWSWVLALLAYELLSTDPVVKESIEVTDGHMQSKIEGKTFFDTLENAITNKAQNPLGYLFKKFEDHNLELWLTAKRPRTQKRNKSPKKKSDKHLPGVWCTHSKPNRIFFRRAHTVCDLESPVELLNLANDIERRWDNWTTKLFTPKEPPPPSLDPALRLYLQQVIEKCNVVWCPGLDNKQGKMQLLQVFSDLHTREAKEEDSKKKSQHSDERVSALKSVMDHPRLALLGDPGGGKSTFLRYLAVGLAHHHLNPHGTDGKRLGEAGCSRDLLNCVPIWVELRKLEFPAHASSATEQEKWLWTEIQKRILKQRENLFQVLSLDLEEITRSGRAIFLLDGLDEITNFGRQQFLQRAVWELVTQDFSNPGDNSASRQNRFVLTCRKRTWFSYLFKEFREMQWKSNTGAEVRAVDQFDENDRRIFLHKWFKERTRIIRCLPAQGSAKEENDRFAQELEALPKVLLQEIKQHKRNPNGRLESLLSVPLNLTLVAWLRSN